MLFHLSLRECWAVKFGTLFQCVTRKRSFCSSFIGRRLCANRPFLYVISERSTGTIFFIGQYLGD